MTNVHPADRLGALKAQIAELEKLAKIEHAKLVALGAGDHEGDIFRATVNLGTPRQAIDWQGIAVALKPSLRYPADTWSDSLKAIVAGNTETKPAVVRVTTNARTGRTLAA